MTRGSCKYHLTKPSKSHTAYLKTPSVLLLLKMRLLIFNTIRRNLFFMGKCSVQLKPISVYRSACKVRNTLSTLIVHNFCGSKLLIEYKLIFLKSIKYVDKIKPSTINIFSMVFSHYLYLTLISSTNYLEVGKMGRKYLVIC